MVLPVNPMQRYKKIIVFFEDLHIRQVAVHYAAALAQRLNAEIVFLLLVEYDSESKDEPEILKEKYKDILLKKVREIISNHIPIKIEVRLGDRRSEFYKFMVDSQSFHTAVWGGEEDVVINRTGRSVNHWMASIKDELACPLIIPKKKKKNYNRSWLDI